MTILKNPLALFQKAINDFIIPNSTSILKQIGIVALGVSIEFILLGFFYWLKNAELTWFLTQQGILSIIFFFLFFIELAFIFTYVSSYIYWLCAKKKGGKGTFLDTCTAIIWIGFYTFISFTFFFIVAGSKESVGSFIQGISCIGLIASIIFGIIRMSIQLSKVHGFHSDQGTNVFIRGTLIQAPLLCLSFFLINAYMKTLFVLLVPVTIQFLTIFSIIIFGNKFLKKLNKKTFLSK
ncbi:MAG: hypothetical protein H0V82_05500 [Candidatus Protochlamydia sp.]|nr:hypothetical protein [Candidatus Protochlamydia sp.]